MPKIVLSILAVFLLVGCASREPVVVLPDGSQITMEVAWSAAEQQKGLMYRENLRNDRGMLFPYSQEAIRTFWMKNTLIPLDILFLDKNGVIVSISNAVPCQENTTCELYSSSGPAQYVLEIPGGQAAAHSLKSGDQLMLKNILPLLPAQE